MNLLTRGFRGIDELLAISNAILIARRRSEARNEL
jgi:hypothetical protein